MIQGHATLIVDLGNSSTKATVLFGKVEIRSIIGCLPLSISPGGRRVTTVHSISKALND